MLLFPLKKEWYEKIKRGEETIEYREVKPYWSKRFYTEISAEFERRFGRRFCSYVGFCFPVVKCGEDAKLKCKLRLGYTNKDGSIGIVAKCSMIYIRDYLINGR